MIGLHGVYPYLVSPVEASGAVKVKVLEELIEHLIAQGVHGLTPLGSTGEFAYLDAEQRLEIVRTAVATTKGRVPVIAGVAATTVRDAIRQTEANIACGADGILAILESYFPLTDQQVEAYFLAIADAAGDRPVVLYTNPNFQRSDLSLSVIERLSHHPAVGYIKDASSNTGRLLSIIERTGGRLKVFAASAHIPAAVMLIGGVGWMAGPACVAPRQSVALYEAAIAGNWTKAMELQRPLWKLNEIFARFGLAACVKTALQLQGFAVGEPIAPQSPLGDEERAVIADVLARLA